MKWLFLFIMTICAACVVAQSEQVTSDESPEEAQVQMAEEQSQHSYSINLNTVNAAELMATGLLNKKQVQDIIYHRETFGKFMSVYELQTVPSLSKDTLLLLSSILHVNEIFNNRHSAKSFLKEGNHYNLIRWSRKTNSSKGYIPNQDGHKVYQGSDYNLLYRFRSSFSSVYQFGISLEKDAGEQLTWQPKSTWYGFDFVSSYLMIYPKKVIRQIAIGDFHFRSGHGLVFGGNFFFSKNPEFWQSNWQIGTGFRPHSSSSEHGFFRGVGSKIQHQNFESSWFYSNTTQDGTMQEDGSISALNTSGLHRSRNEIDKRKNTSLIQTGGNIIYSSTNNRLKTGISYLRTQFEHKFSPTQTYYNANAFRGTEHHIAGAFVQYAYSSGLAFTEVASSSSQGKAIYGGMIHNLSRKNTWMMQYWSSNNSFRSFTGNIPSYSSNLSNENGIYQALMIALSSKARLSLGLSIFNNPNPSYNKKGPAYGSEWISRLTCQLKKKTSVYLQFRWRSNEENFKSDSSSFSSLLPESKYYITADLYHKENIAWSIHSRVQWAFCEYPIKEKGYCISQNIQYKWKFMQSAFQMSLFDTQSWNSRLYVYEPDLPMAFTIPAMYGKGVRFCLTTSFKLFSKQEIAFKAMHINYLQQKSIGSGYDEVMDNEQWEIKIQMRLFIL